MGVAGQVAENMFSTAEWGLAQTTQSFWPSCWRKWLKLPGGRGRLPLYNLDKWSRLGWRNPEAKVFRWWTIAKPRDDDIVSLMKPRDGLQFVVCDLLRVAKGS